MSQPSSSHESNCPDCGGASRRDFLKQTIGGIAAAGAVSSGVLGVMGLPHRAAGAAAPITPAGGASTSETLTAQLYKSLTDEQKKVICFPFDHPLRMKVDNNWHIIKEPITKVFDKDQQAVVRDIFRDMH